MFLAFLLGPGAPQAQQQRGLSAQPQALEEMRTERRVALVIGNGAYGPEIGPLVNPANDAADMAEALRAASFEVKLELDVDRDQMLRAVIEFGRSLRNDGVGLFYYAGHAIQLGGSNYLIPLGAQVDNEDYVPIETVDVNQVLGRMGGADNRLNIVIVDACRNNPFRGVFRSNSRGLASLLAPGGTYIAYAAAPGQVALDGDGRNSPYTSALIGMLAEPGLGLEDVFKGVAAQVLSTTNGFQTPWTASSITGNFYFHVPELQLQIYSIRPPPPPMPGTAVDITVWGAIASSQNPQDFEVFLESYPDSPLVPFARRRLAELRSTETGTSTQTEVVPSAAIPDKDREARESATTYQAGDVFRDCEVCPEMVVVSAGSFMMGSTEAERQWAVDEGAKREWVDTEMPQHLVWIAEPFAVGKYEVTFDEWDACVTGGSCGGYEPSDQGWSRGRRPVINVSWEDAKAYLAWLSVKSGQSYRLLSEAEWEYVGRAGATNRYSWGDEDATPAQANFGKHQRKTTEVGSYPPNPWGLFDMHGNVWEWVEDCWNQSYEGAPTSGIAWTSGYCSRRVLRGGSWANRSGDLRSANRHLDDPASRDYFKGLRVARALH